MEVGDGIHLSATKYHKFSREEKKKKVRLAYRQWRRRARWGTHAATGQSKSNRKSYESAGNEKWKLKRSNTTKVFLISATIYNK